MIELDVAMSADGRFFAYHYPVPNLRGHYLRHRPASEIRGVDTIEALLDVLSSRRPVYLDVKELLSPSEISALLDIVSARHTNAIVVGSFHGSVLACVRDSYPSCTLNFHCLAVLRAIRIAVGLGVDWINPIPYGIRRSFVDEAHRAGLKFVPAGNESDRKQLRYAAWGAYALSTFRPAYLRGILSRHNGSEPRADHLR